MALTNLRHVYNPSFGWDACRKLPFLHAMVEVTRSACCGAAACLSVDA